MKVVTKLLIVAVIASGCAASPVALQGESSGQLGCAPEKIVVSDYQLRVSTSTWTATCGDKKYYCSASDTLKGTKCALAKD